MLQLLRRELRAGVLLLEAHRVVRFKVCEPHALVAEAAPAEPVSGRRAAVVAVGADVHTLGSLAAPPKVRPRSQRRLVVGARVAEDTTALAAVAPRNVLVLRPKLDLADGTMGDALALDPAR